MANYYNEVQEMIKLMKDASQKEILPKFCNVKSHFKENNTKFKELVTEVDIRASEFVLSKIKKNFLVHIPRNTNIRTDLNTL